MNICGLLECRFNSVLFMYRFKVIRVNVSWLFVCVIVFCVEFRLWWCMEKVGCLLFSCVCCNRLVVICGSWCVVWVSCMVSGLLLLGWLVLVMLVIVVVCVDSVFSRFRFGFSVCSVFLIRNSVWIRDSRWVGSWKLVFCLMCVMC